MDGTRNWFQLIDAQLFSSCILQLSFKFFSDWRRAEILFSYYNKLRSRLISHATTPLKTNFCCPNPSNTRTKVTGIMGEKTVQLKNSLSKHCFFNPDRCWQCCLVMSVCAKTLTSKPGEGWIYKTESRTESFSVQHLLRPTKPSHQFCCSNERLSSSCQPFNHQPALWP